jgi:hypothetical protein
MNNDRINLNDGAAAASSQIGSAVEQMFAPRAHFAVECRDKDGNLKWSEHVTNLVTTAGKNDLLDKYFSGSAYTAAFFMGLVSLVGFTGIAAADTMASHAGWTEAGATNAPNYSAGTRPALTFSAAAAASKTTTAATAYTFSGAGTIKGLFLSTNSTKDGTTGILYNAVLFTGGDRLVAASDVVNVTPTFTA